MPARSASICAASPKPFSMTSAPSAASARATPSPIPLVDPVTSATLPARPMTSAPSQSHNLAGIVVQDCHVGKRHNGDGDRQHGCGPAADATPAGAVQRLRRAAARRARGAEPAKGHPVFQPHPPGDRPAVAPAPPQPLTDEALDDEQMAAKQRPYDMPQFTILQMTSAAHGRRDPARQPMP